MKIRCPKESLLAALQSASAVVPSRSPKPVLTNVKVEATRDGVVLMATDLEVGIRIDLEGVETVAPGAVLLPSGRLAAIVRESPAGTVFDIHSDGTAALVSAAKRVSSAGRGSARVPRGRDVSNRQLRRDGGATGPRTRAADGVRHR